MPRKKQSRRRTRRARRAPRRRTNYRRYKRKSKRSKRRSSRGRRTRRYKKQTKCRVRPDSISGQCPPSFKPWVMSGGSACCKKSTWADYQGSHAGLGWSPIKMGREYRKQYGPLTRSGRRGMGSTNAIYVDPILSKFGPGAGANQAYVDPILSKFGPGAARAASQEAYVDPILSKFGPGASSAKAAAWVPPPPPPLPKSAWVPPPPPPLPPRWPQSTQGQWLSTEGMLKRRSPPPLPPLPARWAQPTQGQWLNL